MASVTRGQPLILIVDDDDTFQHALTLELHQAGMNAESLRDGTRLTEIAAEVQPDVVLLDADVGGQDGRDLVAALMRQPKAAHIPIFMGAEERLSALRKATPS